MPPKHKFVRSIEKSRITGKPPAKETVRQTSPLRGFSASASQKIAEEEHNIEHYKQSFREAPNIDEKRLYANLIRESTLSIKKWVKKRDFPELIQWEDIRGPI